MPSYTTDFHRQVNTLQRDVDILKHAYTRFLRIFSYKMSYELLNNPLCMLIMSRIIFNYNKPIANTKTKKKLNAEKKMYSVRNISSGHKMTSEFC